MQFSNKISKSQNLFDVQVFYKILDSLLPGLYKISLIFICIGASLEAGEECNILTVHREDSKVRFSPVVQVETTPRERFGDDLWDVGKLMHTCKV